MKYHLFYILCFFLLCLPQVYLQAQTQTEKSEDATPDILQLEEIMVQASMIEDTVVDIPKAVTVITDADIEQNPGNSIVDLINSESGINITSYTGHIKKAGLDIRGMGATASSNVLVIVDGIRLNAPDLSGADLSSIDLDDIEKIEIIHGPETVLYGDGAVAGIIRITTKKGRKKPLLKVNGSVRSFDTLSSSIQYSSRPKDFGLKLFGSYLKTDGYRDNGFFKKTNGGTRLDYQMGKDFNVFLNIKSQEDRYGLPGPVSIEDIDSEENRKKTNSPDDYGETTDNQIIGGLQYKLNSGGKINLKRGYRFRDNSFLLGYSPSSAQSKEQQKGFIDEDTKTFQLYLEQPYRLGKLKIGVDQFQSYYIREANAQLERHNSNTNSLGIFLSHLLIFRGKNKWTIGARSNRFEGKFRKDTGTWEPSISSISWSNGDLIEREWSNQSYSTGLVFRLTEKTRIFGSMATSFRTPNVDEFAQSDEDLKPQNGTHIELGIRKTKSDFFNYSLIAFQMRNENEIYYGTDPSTNLKLNRNYEDTTLRRGVQAKFKNFPTDSIYLSGNIIYLMAQFEGNGKTIPLVPSLKSNLKLEYSHSNRLIFSFSGTNVGERYDGNDDKNSLYKKLKGYSVVNSKASFTFRKGKKLQCGVNNLFNELYSTIAYSETYYPMPTRNYYCELKLRF